jgi:hypothetical protein
MQAKVLSQNLVVYFAQPLPVEIPPRWAFRVMDAGVRAAKVDIGTDIAIKSKWLQVASAVRTIGPHGAKA